MKVTLYVINFNYSSDLISDKSKRYNWNWRLKQTKLYSHLI